MADICSENESTIPGLSGTAVERGGCWRGDLGGQLRGLANGLVGRPLGDGSGVWVVEQKKCFYNSKLRSLLKIARHQLASDLNNRSSFPLRRSKHVVPSLGST